MTPSLRKEIYFPAGSNMDVARKVGAKDVVDHELGRLRLTPGNIQPNEIPQDRLKQLASHPLFMNEILFQPQTRVFKKPDHTEKKQEVLVVHGFNMREEPSLGGSAFDVRDLSDIAPELLRIIASRIVVQAKKLPGFKEFKIVDGEGNVTVVDADNKPLITLPKKK